MSGFFFAKKKPKENTYREDFTKEQVDSIGTLPREFSEVKGLIGPKYEAKGLLGKGGFGVVYLVYSREAKKLVALKTFKDEFLADQEIRKRFQKEANVWIELGKHPYLVQALFVDNKSGRLFIGMEYIAPNELGLNSLEGYLQRRPPDLAQSLRWAIQICNGMQYAYTKGIRVHRDLKPNNIMISPELNAKITDFGLAGVISERLMISPDKMDAHISQPQQFYQTAIGEALGTPTHMAPEQFEDATRCDERSDIYSFGIILYQMATKGKLPFLAHVDADFWLKMHELHSKAQIPRVNSPLYPIIQHCLEKSPERRPFHFEEIQSELEKLLRGQEREEFTLSPSSDPGLLEWCNKGFSLGSLGRYEEAIACYDRVLNVIPNFPQILVNKANDLNKLGRYQEAIQCLDKALVLDPQNAIAWNNKGNSLSSLKRDEEAIDCFDEALRIDPGRFSSLVNKGNSLRIIGRLEEANECFDKVIQNDPGMRDAWYNKGLTLIIQHEFIEAMSCFDRTIAIDPFDKLAWVFKGKCLDVLKRDHEALDCFTKALEMDPTYVDSWVDKGRILESLNQSGEAIRCYDKVLELDPRNGVWYDRGRILLNLGRNEEALNCFQYALDLFPQNVLAINSQAFTLTKLNRYAEAIRCFETVLNLEPNNVYARFNKALAQEKTGDVQGAINSFHDYLTIAPANEKQRIEYAHYYLQKFTPKQNDHKEG